MTREARSRTSGQDRGLRRAFALLLASHVLTLPIPAYAQQAATGTPSSVGSAAHGQTQTYPDTASDLQAITPADASTNAADPTPSTGSLPAAEDDAGISPLRDDDMLRQNLREPRVDGTGSLPQRTDEDDSGIRLGSFILRPSISQQLGHERNGTAGNDTSRSFSETGLKGTLTSDWSRHELRLSGDGAWQKTLSGEGNDKPRANLDAALRLDLADDTTLGVNSFYRFSREDTDDPNALANASVQSGVHEYGGGLSLERDFGRIRGALNGDLTRLTYSDAELSDGTTVARSDRDRLRGTITGRIGYELSPALIPFVELSAGRIRYDETLDSAGFRRSADVYGARGGVALDLGEKLRGELAIGHEEQRFDDARLAALSALTVDGNLDWSPREGTLVSLTWDTSIDPSTTAGVNGAVVHQLRSSLSYDLRSNLVARLTGGTTLTRYDGDTAGTNSTAWLAGAGLTWKVNRYLDATADLTYERTKYKSAADNDSLTALVGLTLKR